jgi:hypothetical protein
MGGSLLPEIWQWMDAGFTATACQMKNSEQVEFAGSLTRLLRAALNQKFVANPTINVIAPSTL